ncbi:MAG: flagellar basal body P-ring formation protein FlgA [Firmicutes bacterium]|nr:flagellar basal body P-ring formation protein FlgA [Bacillota bacterium]
MLRRTIFILVIVFALAVSTGVGATNFQFLNSVEAQSDQVTLADLVSPESRVPAAWEEVVVVQAPSPRRSITVTEPQVKRALREAGVDPDGLEAVIPERVVVHTPGQVILPADVQAEFQRQLEAVLKLPVEGFRIKLVGWTEELTAPLGEVRISILEEREDLWESLLRSYASFAYEIKVQDQVVKSGRARVRVFGTIQVPVLTRDLQRHEVVGPEDLTWREMELARLTPETILDPEDAVGQRTTRSIRGGLPLAARDLEVPPLVQYRSRVRLTAEYRGIYLETVGQALMDGGLGDIIKVENIASGKIVSAEVVGPGEVKVLL